MTADRVEKLIAKPLEAAMREIAELDEIKSTSTLGTVNLIVAIHDRIDNLEPVFQDIRNKAGDVKSELPEGTQERNGNDEEGLTAVSTVALWADAVSLAEMHDVSRATRHRLYSLPAVRRVQMLGPQAERIYLATPATRFAQPGASPRPA